jgi:hypothetical protein
MPVNLSIKNVPDVLAARLKLRAEANHRSLQGELMALIEGALVSRVAEQSVPRYGVSSPDPSSAHAHGRVHTLREIFEAARKARNAESTSARTSVSLLQEARAEREVQLARLTDADESYERALALLGTVSTKPAPTKPRVMRSGRAATKSRARAATTRG